MFAFSVLFCFFILISMNYITGMSLAKSDSTEGISVFSKCRYGGAARSERWNAVEAGNFRGVRYPCLCHDDQCGCCTGNFLLNFNVNVRQRFCLNVTYDSDDGAIGMKFSFNDFTIFKSSVSGKNPQPVCVPVPRFSTIRFCVRLTNVYFIGRNVHACVTVESQWNKETSFVYNFDCIRIGLNGVAVVSPEDGGGLPETSSPDVDLIEEYDELLENQTTKRPNGIKKKRKRTTLIPGSTSSVRPKW